MDVPRGKDLLAWTQSWTHGPWDSVHPVCGWLLKHRKEVLVLHSNISVSNNHELKKYHVSIYHGSMQKQLKSVLYRSQFVICLHSERCLNGCGPQEKHWYNTVDIFQYCFPATTCVQWYSIAVHYYRFILQSTVFILKRVRVARKNEMKHGNWDMKEMGKKYRRDRNKVMKQIKERKREGWGIKIWK